MNATDWFNRPRVTRPGTIIINDRGEVEMRDFRVEPETTPESVVRTVIDWGVRRLIATRKDLLETEPTGIDKYVTAIRHSIRTQNWFGALFLALAMPDICGALESPRAGVGERYRLWFERYMAINYRPEQFSPGDCYYLRCAALHQGISEHPKAQNKQAVFVTPTPNDQTVFHRNYSESPDGSFVIQLQIDVFCEEICEGVLRWKADVASSAEIQSRVADLLYFQSPSEPFRSKA